MAHKRTKIPDKMKASLCKRYRTTTGSEWSDRNYPSLEDLEQSTEASRKTKALLMKLRSALEIASRNLSAVQQEATQIIQYCEAIESPGGVRAKSLFYEELEAIRAFTLYKEREQKSLAILEHNLSDFSYVRSPAAKLIRWFYYRDVVDYIEDGHYYMDSAHISNRQEVILVLLLTGAVGWNQNEDENANLRFATKIFDTTARQRKKNPARVDIDEAARLADSEPNE